MKRSTMVVNATVSVAEGMNAIHELNLEKVLKKLQKPAPRGNGWTQQEAEKAEKWYKRFLELVLKYPGETLVPNEEVDELWHAHVLDMKQYEMDTNKMFGRILYHKPSFDTIDLRPFFKRTNELLFVEFGEDFKASGDYDPKSCCCPQRSEEVEEEVVLMA